MITGMELYSSCNPCEYISFTYNPLTSVYQKPHLYILNWVTLLKFGLEVSTCAAVKPV